MTEGSMTEGNQARRYLRAHCSGVLSTLSRRLGGYPFGSIVPFVPDHDAVPVILVSRLAEHTKNLEADPRASLFVHDAGDDVQSSARLTLVGDARRIDADDALRARYLRYHPDAERLLALGDFSFFRIAPAFIRHIAGLGAIRSITPASYAPPSSGLGQAEEEMIASLNASEHDLLVACCRARNGVRPASATLVGIDADGFDLRADGRLQRCDFTATVADVNALRSAIAAVAKGILE